METAEFRGAQLAFGDVDPVAALSFRLIEGLSRFTAHGLGNPLTGLTLSLDLLAGAKLPESQQRLVQRCMRVTERLAAQKENLGALGGSVKSRAESVDTEVFCRAVLDEQKLSDVYSASVEVADGARHMRCFPALLADALRYLVRNATDAMPDGGALGIRVAPYGDGLRVTVWDEGPGLADGLEKDLFRLPTTSRTHGMGFGLLLVAMIVAHIHRGRVTFTPNQPSGCQFHLDLPTRKGE